MSTSASFAPPSVELGYQVWYHRDPTNLSDPSVGWVSRRPGASTLCIVVWAGGGLVEKLSVRHKDDPGLQENQQWRQWGCWELSPMQKALNKAAEMATAAVLQQARKPADKS